MLLLYYYCYTTAIWSTCSVTVLHLHTFWCKDSTMWGKLANWNNTKKMSWEERCCHSSWLVPPTSASKCSSLSERSMAYTTRSTSCSSSTGHRCFCWRRRRGVLKDKENSGQGDRLKGKTARNRTRQRKERGGRNIEDGRKEGERQNEGMIIKILCR